VAYQCVLPKLVDEPEEEEKKKAEADKAAAPAPEAGTVLQPLKANCLYRMEGWWTYEFCFGAGVKQFHHDQQTGTRVSEFVMGKYESAASVLVTDVEGKQIRQRYVGGTACDLGQQQARSVEVRYLCNDKPNGITFVGELQEPATCQYSLAVLTPLVCDMLHVKTASRRAAPVIFCNPVSVPVPPAAPAAAAAAVVAPAAPETATAVE
jgi:endoplasmic reticulum lectin 1